MEGARHGYGEALSADLLLLISCHVSALAGADVDAVIHLEEFDGALRTALQLPDSSEGLDIKLQTLVESTQAETTRQRRYGMLKNKFIAGTRQEKRYDAVSRECVSDDLLSRMFGLSVPTPLELRTRRCIMASRRCMDARNMALVKTVQVLSAPDGIEVWIKDPCNEVYIRHWVSAVALWIPNTLGPPLDALSSNLLSRCRLLVDPPTQNDPSDFWRKNSAQHAVVIGMYSEWEIALVKANRSNTHPGDLSELTERTSKILARIAPANAAATKIVLDNLVLWIRWYASLGSPESPVHAVAAKLEAMMADVEEYRKSEGFRLVMPS